MSTGDPNGNTGAPAAWQLLEQVMDPEIPMLSIVDLGIVRRVEADGRRVTVDLTPTYSGCPATEVIERDAREALAAVFADVEVHTVLSPAWTTDWITERGRMRLREAGIAPPRPVAAPVPNSMRVLAVVGDAPTSSPECPRCGSSEVEEISRFGSTACKSLWRCSACREPFDHFKPL